MQVSFSLVRSDWNPTTPIPLHTISGAFIPESQYPVAGTVSLFHKATVSTNLSDTEKKACWPLL